MKPCFLFVRENYPFGFPPTKYYTLIVSSLRVFSHQVTMLFPVLLLFLIVTTSTSATECNEDLDCEELQCGWPKCPNGANPVSDRCVACCPFCPEDDR
ncbi:hypothetical protein TNIN_436261 [Trichonephila inaurata madagascariensis]|uniref:Uncharacterized protein n=1 Tax=Trichonephila inaurata madagascariensis TaxID=2747483 RepID=A0A8X7CBF4_9ARAC|nr:hypothetical protein TNIN_436261 [Trichonephila inaurata madagascariensis]